MVTHIVMWKVMEEVEGLGKTAILEKIKVDLESLKGKVPEIRDLRAGISAKSDRDSWDIVLYTTFDSFDGLDSYQKNPEHLKVAQFIGKVRKERSVVDFES